MKLYCEYSGLFNFITDCVIILSVNLTGYMLNIPGIRREEEKVKRSLKEAAKKGDKDVCRILAREVVNARRSVTRIYSSKAHISSTILTMNQQLGLYI